MDSRAYKIMLTILAALSALAPSYSFATGSALSAYFGASNVAPNGAIAGCGNLVNQNQTYDGIPIVFPKQIAAPITVSMFVATGTTTNPVCATLYPATSCYSSSTGCPGGTNYDEYLGTATDLNSYGTENFTVLTVWPANTFTAGSSPGSISIGSSTVPVYSVDGTTNFAPSTIAVTAYGSLQNPAYLTSGASIMKTFVLPPGEVPVSTTLTGSTTAPSVSSVCPTGTKSAALIIWAGGVLNANNTQISSAEVAADYRITVGSVTQAPDGLADADSGVNRDLDNNQIVCTKSTGTITAISVAASTDYDPSNRGNPAVSVAVPLN